MNEGWGGRGHRRGRTTDSASTVGREVGDSGTAEDVGDGVEDGLDFVDFSIRIACSYIANPAVHSPGPVHTLLTLAITEEFKGQGVRSSEMKKPADPAFFSAGVGEGVFPFLLRRIASLMAGEKSLMMMVGGAGGSEEAPGVDEGLGVDQDLVR